MEQRKLKPGDRVQVVLETEVICELPNGLVLVRMVGMPLPYSAIKAIPGVNNPDLQPENMSKPE